MLEGQLEAGEPTEGTHPEDPCPGAGTAMEKTAAAAEVSREDGNAGEMPPLQQQITRLHQELGRQESLWADVHRKLQNHIDALRKQNLELQEVLRGLQRQQREARKKPGARPHAGRESHTLAWEPAFGKMSPLSVDEETMPKYVGRKSPSATVLGQRSSSNSLTPPKPMSLKTERINLGTTAPQEDREKGPPGRYQDGNPSPTGRPTPGAGKRGVSEDGKVMHPSSRSPQNSSGRKSAVQASQAATLQEQMAAAGGAGEQVRGLLTVSMLPVKCGTFLSIRVSRTSYYSKDMSFMELPHFWPPLADSLVGSSPGGLADTPNCHPTHSPRAGVQGLWLEVLNPTDHFSLSTRLAEGWDWVASGALFPFLCLPVHGIAATLKECPLIWHLPGLFPKPQLCPCSCGCFLHRGSQQEEPRVPLGESGKNSFLTLLPENDHSSFTNPTGTYLDGSSSILESSEGRFLSHVQADELTGSSPNIEELQNLPVNPPPSLETAQPMDTKMKKEEVQEEKRHPNDKADDGRWSSFPESISRSSACCCLQTGHGS
ncbi:hypothetical protein H8959_009684 [Pygathrix nigripes]